MKLTDYLNSSKGSTLVAVYGALITILTFNVLIAIMCWRSEWKDIPTGAAGVMLLIIGMISGAHLLEQRMAQPTPPATPAQQAQEPAEPAL